METSGHTILLVEDNEDDVFLMQRALMSAKLDIPMQVSRDGQEALDYLQGTGKFSDRVAHPMPALVFLDLKLPYVHGFEVLSWIRGESSLKELPVVVLTSSSEDRDRTRAEELGARGYLVKPPTADMIRDVMNGLFETTRLSEG